MVRTIRSMMALACLSALAIALGGCGSFGAKSLNQDWVDYAQALSLSQKRQILANIIGLRYADSPSFLAVSQIIAGHSQVVGLNATGTWAGASANTNGAIGATLSLTS
ncbi:MAG: hypothetical protein JO002_13700, partial [Burkholderiaceae bacterium]|nr:hypothetical protein [Burkholderiaceae bacterium]